MLVVDSFAEPLYGMPYTDRVVVRRCGNRKTADVIAASASVAVGHTAMDAAVANYPDQPFNAEEWDTRDQAASGS